MQRKILSEIWPCELHFSLYRFRLASLFLKSFLSSYFPNNQSKMPPYKKRYLGCTHLIKTLALYHRSGYLREKSMSFIQFYPFLNKLEFFTVTARMFSTSKLKKKSDT